MYINEKCICIHYHCICSCNQAIKSFSPGLKLLGGRASRFDEEQPEPWPKVDPQIWDKNILVLG